MQLKNGCGVFLGHHMAWRPHEFLIDPDEEELSLSFFFSWVSFFLFHILLFCSSLIFPPNYNGPGWTQTDLNQPKRSWTSSDITLCNLLAAFSENLFRLFWDRGLSQMTSATKGKGERGGQISRLQDHTGSSCGRADHTTTIFLRVVLSHNHNHNIFYMFWRTNIWWVCPSIVMWGLFLKRRERHRKLNSRFFKQQRSIMTCYD